MENLPKFKKEENKLDESLLTELVLPAKQTGAIKLKPERKVAVRSNCHLIDFKEIVFHHYECKFFVQMSTRTKDLSEGVKNAANAETRRLLLKHLWEKLLSGHPEIFSSQNKFIYDCSCMLISPVDLSVPSEPIEIDVNSIKGEFRACMPKKIEKLYVTLKFVQNIQLNDDAIKRADELEARDRSPIQVLELIYNQYILFSDKFHVLPGKSFLKDLGSLGSYPEIQGRKIKDGLSKGIRPCGNNPNKPQLMIQIDSRKGAFYPPIRLADYLIKHYDGRNSEDLKKKFREKGDIEKLAKELKNLTLVTTHLSKNRIFRCYGIDTKSARERTFVVEKKGGDEPDSKRQRVEKSIYEYYKEKYKNLSFEYSNYPCIIERTFERGTKNVVLNYYPLDVLKIADGQRVPIQKMNGTFQEKMIKESCVNPSKVIRSMEILTGEAMLTASNPYARAYGCPMSSEPMKIEAEVLHPPALKFSANLKVEYKPEGQLISPPDHRKFLINGQIKKWIVVNYNGKLDSGLVDKFIGLINTGLGKRGTKIEKPSQILKPRSAEEIFTYAKSNKPQFILFLTNKEDGDFLHREMKHFELSSGIVTQHVNERTVQNTVDKGQRVTMENIIMKSNEKTGGTNFSIVSGQSFIRVNQRVSREAARLLEQWLGQNRMFIGIDLSNTSSDTSKAVVGIAYNVDSDTHEMTGFPFYIDSQQTVIQNLGRYLRRAIEDFKKRSKRKTLPSHLIIYRGGVSEGAYLSVIAHEKVAIKTLLAELQKEHRCPPIGFTMITAQRQHKYRLMPGDAATSSGNQGRGGPQGGNLPIGTIIYEKITDPNKEQFILLSHKAFQGMPKPIVYTVVADEAAGKKRLSRDELSYVTHSLCFAHGSVTSPVSRPSYLYWAGEVAKRGTANLGVELKNNPNSQSLSPEELNERLNVTNSNKYFS